MLYLVGDITLLGCQLDKAPAPDSRLISKKSSDHNSNTQTLSLWLEDTISTLGFSSRV
jgi:hypothetical protein